MIDPPPRWVRSCCACFTFFTTTHLLLRLSPLPACARRKQYRSSLVRSFLHCHPGAGDSLYFRTESLSHGAREILLGKELCFVRPGRKSELLLVTGLEQAVGGEKAVVVVAARAYPPDSAGSVVVRCVSQVTRRWNCVEVAAVTITHRVAGLFSTLVCSSCSASINQSFAAAGCMVSDYCRGAS